MKLCIVGGRLQGLEAAYLARKAGFETTVVDRDVEPPARGVADRFLHSAVQDLEGVLPSFDCILPATENIETLTYLDETARRLGVPLALDLASYRVTSSKLRSNELFASAEIPTPDPWPQCGFPVIVKPSGSSGSTGVSRVFNEETLNRALAELGKEVVIQQFVGGPSFSLEVMAHRGRAVGFQVTELEFDGVYDCKRVLAGPATGREVEAEFRRLGERIASALNLSGIMDIEVMSPDDGLKVLEIDARLPSQTPTAVFHSTGINMVELLARYWTSGRPPDPLPAGTRGKAVIYEHLRRRDKTIEVSGEHILADAGLLAVMPNAFGFHEFISNCQRNPLSWEATAVIVEDTEDLARKKRDRAIQNLLEAFRCETLLDPSPPDE